jgi:L-cysteine S-thiosulfotransferase
MALFFSLPAGLALGMSACVSAGTALGAGATAAAPLAESAPVTKPGDAARGRAIVVDRQRGMCLLCHGGPFVEEPTPGDIATNLAGVGSRYSAAELRQRVADSRSFNPASIMPTYAQPSRGARVAPTRAGQALLSEQELDDVLAFLRTLK